MELKNPTQPTFIEIFKFRVTKFSISYKQTNDHKMSFF